MKEVIALLLSATIVWQCETAEAYPAYANSSTDPGVTCSKCHSDGRVWQAPVVNDPPPSVTTLAPPTLNTSISGNNVSLSWSKVSGATAYTLNYALYPYKGPGSIHSINMGAALNFSTSLSDGSAYYVAITAKNESAQSNYSNVGLVVINSQSEEKVTSGESEEKRDKHDRDDSDDQDSTGANGGSGTTTGNASRDVMVFASNDLGMHCACPGTEYFLLLPPFNTVRAQVVERGDEPRMLGANDGITVKYKMVENTDESLKNDPYYSIWLENMPKYGFGSGVRSDGKIQGVSGATLDGEMSPQSEGWWEVEGVPAYPDATLSSSQERVMVDPLGGPNRNPYLTTKVEVYDSATGEKLAETSTVVPVAFGGCCNCHLQVTKDHGLAPTEGNSFALMGQLHERDSGINFAKLDPDGDGTPGPIRCSVCHLDPAMGESVAPGYPGLPTSKYTFSNVLHRWHVENPAVLDYNKNLAKDCYACHPGNNVGCFRGVHADKGMWCTDCHGDLNQRVAEGQVDNPWSAETLPKCNDCHEGTGEGGTNIHAFGGLYLNSMGHKDEKVLCSTCHGSPHALYPSTEPRDNVQPMTIQGSASAIGKCSVCHTGATDAWEVPPHGDSIPSIQGGGSGGTGSGVDAATALQTTCLNCHSDKSGRVSCSNSKWVAHDGSRVSSTVYAAVTAYVTGSTCQSSGGNGSGSGSGGTASGVDAATALKTTCLNCHSDKSNKVSCSSSKWIAHDGSRVSSSVFDAVSTYLIGSTCQNTNGGSSGESHKSRDDDDEDDD